MKRNHVQILGIFVLAFLGVALRAQTPLASPGPGNPTAPVGLTQQPSPAISFQILSQIRVDSGRDSTFFNYVMPPVFPAATPIITLPPTAAYLTWLQLREKKALKFLTLSATVYDHKITDLRCSDGTGNCRVFSNIDFFYFTGLGEFETADTIYEYVLMVGNATSDSLTEKNPAPTVTQSDQPTSEWLTTAFQQLPNLSIFPTGRASYLVADAPAYGNSKVLASLDAMHAYYDANRVQLIATYQQRATAQGAAQAYAKEHPPGPPPPVVINFWPIKNSRYITTGTEGNNR